MNTVVDIIVSHVTDSGYRRDCSNNEVVATPVVVASVT